MGRRLIVVVRIVGTIVVTWAILEYAPLIENGTRLALPAAVTVLIIGALGATLAALRR